MGWGETRTGVVKREKSKNVKGAVTKTNCPFTFLLFSLFRLHSFLSSTGEIISSILYIDTIMEMERVEKRTNVVKSKKSEKVIRATGLYG
jgi:hypothetical protein